MNGDPIARRAGTQSRISDSILTTDRGPSSQLSGPIAGFLACVEDAQRLRLPSAPSPRRGPTGLHRTQFRNPNRKSRKREKGKRSEAECFLSRATRLAQQKLFTICKFRMIFVALIPVMNYNAQIAFKKRIANGDLWLCTGQHEWPRSQLAGSRVDGCRLCKSVQGKSLRCEDRSRRAGQGNSQARARRCVGRD